MFVELMTEWLASPECPPLVRLALGVVLVIPASSREAGYQLLDDFLTAVQLEPENTSDFSYQINRPRSSVTLNGLKINRLTKWSVAAFQSFLTAPTGLVMGAAEHSVRLEMDINTAPSGLEEIPKTKVFDLLHELVSLAEEIATDGEKP